MVDEWLTVRQAAKALGRRVNWLYHLIDKEDPRLVVEKREGWPFRVSAKSVAGFEHRPPGNPKFQTKAVTPKRSKNGRDGKVRSAR